QSFLNSKVQTCDTSGAGLAKNDGFSNPTPYSNETRAQYASRVGWHSPPYVCLRDYKQDTPQVPAASGLCEGLAAKNNQTAAQIIYEVAQACHINPQVF